MNRSTLLLSVIAVTALILGFLSVQNGMSSIYQTGLINLTSRYDKKFADQVVKHEQQKQGEEYNTQVKMLENINLLTQRMLSWNNSDPDKLVYAAYTLLLNSYSEENIDKYDYFVKESISLTRKAIEIRPIYPDIYAQQAYAINSLGEPLDLVLKHLYIAERYGPYERATAKAGIDFYFGFWDQISNKDKIKASRYVLNPEKYGLSQYEMHELIQGATYKERVCKLLSFTGNRPKLCQK